VRDRFFEPVDFRARPFGFAAAARRRIALVLPADFFRPAAPFRDADFPDAFFRDVDPAAFRRAVVALRVALRFTLLMDLEAPATVRRVSVATDRPTAFVVAIALDAARPAAATPVISAIRSASAPAPFTPAAIPRPTMFAPASIKLLTPAAVSLSADSVVGDDSRARRVSITPSSEAH
jgi:hypothetical protein